MDVPSPTVADRLYFAPLDARLRFARELASRHGPAWRAEPRVADGVERLRSAAAALDRVTAEAGLAELCGECGRTCDDGCCQPRMADEATGAAYLVEILAFGEPETGEDRGSELPLAPSQEGAPRAGWQGQLAAPGEAGTEAGPGTEAETETETGRCPFLGDRGCVLRLKPFICVNHLCPEVHEALSPEAVDRVRRATAEVLSMQVELEERLVALAARATA